MRTIRKIEQSIPNLRQRKKVAAYARVSVESERMHHSLSAQVSYYSRLIQKKPRMGICRGLCRLWDFGHRDKEAAGVPADAGRCRKRKNRYNSDKIYSTIFSQHSGLVKYCTSSKRDRGRCMV